MGEHGVDSLGSGKGQIAGVFERSSEYTPPPPKKNAVIRD